MSLRLDGLNPLSYMGVKPTQPPNLVVKNSAPTANDLQNINIGTFWLVYPGQQLWFLISVAEGTATWVQLYPNGGGGGGGAEQFPTDDGTANEAGGILNILGDGNIITHGAGNTVTLTMAGDFVENFETDAGTAHPSSNTLRVLGGTNINTSGTSNAVTVNLDDSVSLAGTLGVSGTTTLDGAVVISAQTDGVLQTNGAGTVTATNGTNGQVLIGGGTAPEWANLTSDGGTIIITNGPNTINLESTGGGGGGSPVSFYAYQETDYSVPRPASSSVVAYPMGSANILTVNFNNGGAFYPGDGVGTPASFTAPVSGSYYFAFNVLVRGGTNPNQNINTAFAQIVTSATTQTYSAQISNNDGGASLSYTFVQVQANATLQLSLGDVVTFQSLVAAVGGVSGVAYVVSGLRAIGGFTPTTVTSIEGFLIQASSSGGGTGSGTINFSAYQPTDLSVPLNNPGQGETMYSMGTLTALTVTQNSGGAFYPGDGAGTQASFTAPVNGVYGFLFNTCAFRGQPSSLNLMSNVINTPTGLIGELGNRLGGGSATTQDGVTISNNAVVTLNQGDVVTFQIYNNSGTAPFPSFRLFGVQTPYPNFFPGVSFPVTYINGWLIQEL